MSEWTRANLIFNAVCVLGWAALAILGRDWIGVAGTVFHGLGVILWLREAHYERARPSAKQRSAVR